MIRGILAVYHFIHDLIFQRINEFVAEAEVDYLAVAGERCLLLCHGGDQSGIRVTRVNDVFIGFLGRYAVEVTGYKNGKSLKGR
jgi:hypothetical protein